MAFKTGFVDNTTATGPNTLAHHNFLDELRRFVSGDGRRGVIAQTGTGNGKLVNFRVMAHGLTENWTITCTAVAVDGGTFSVVGSVSGAQAAATVGVDYIAAAGVSFKIIDGTVDFIVGDQFTVSATANSATVPPIQGFIGAGAGTLTGFFAYDAGASEVWTIKCKTTAANGGTFSVTGSTSGAKADATVGVLYDNGFIKFTINDGAPDFALNDTFTVIPQRWKVLRWDDGGGNPDNDRELILQGNGYTGLEEIFVGFRTNHLVSADYYNMSTAFFTGYVPSNTYILQPGFAEVGFCAHNIRLDYWMIANGQRIAAGLKIATPVYEPFYVGKFLPYGNPGQYPYPVVAIGTLAGKSTTRFSDTAHSMGFKGNTTAIKMRFVDGSIKSPECVPWCHFTPGFGPVMRDTQSNWPIHNIVLNDTTQGDYGELEGVCYVTGFNNVVENTLDQGGTNWIVIQDVYRTGFNDYLCLELK